jgi:hypothetical protein
MSCTEFESALCAAVEDRHAGHVEQLREHAAGCVHCHALWEQFAILEQAIPAWSTRQPQVQLADAVLARLGDQRTAREMQPVGVAPAAAPQPARSRRRLAAAAAVAVSACALVIAFWPASPAVDLPGEGSQIADTAPAATDEQKPAQAEPAANAIELDKVATNDQPSSDQPSAAEIGKLVREASAAYMVLAEGAADAVVHTPILLPRTDLVASDHDDESDDARAESWIDGWGEQLQPIGKDVGNAIDFLLDAVPLDPTTI